jgi:hypothetical protein
MDGYIKLARCLLNKPIFQNEKLLKVWIWCLMKASHKEHTQLVGLQKIDLKPGQFITGRNAGAQQLKMKPSTFWDYMQWLKGNQSLDIKTDNKKSLVTLINWEQYQVSPSKSDSETDHKATAKQPLSDTNNNGNKGKNTYTVGFDQFWTEYPKKVSKQDAVKAWQKIKPDSDMLAKILQSLAVQKKSANWLKENGQYVPNAATWLNGKRWEDEVKASKQNALNLDEWGYRQ